MKLRIAFWLLAATVAYLLGTSILRDGYSPIAALALTLFNPITWVWIVVAVLMARRTKAGVQTPH